VKSLSMVITTIVLPYGVQGEERSTKSQEPAKSHAARVRSFVYSVVAFME